MVLVDVDDVAPLVPYHFFKNPKDNNFNLENETLFPRIPNSMKTKIKKQIKAQMDLSTKEILNEILNNY